MPSWPLRHLQYFHSFNFLQNKIHFLCFFQICPSLLVKKDRGRPTNPNARPKAYGEITVASDVPDLELLQEADISSDDDDVADEIEDEDDDDDVDGGSSVDVHDEDDVSNVPSEEQEEEEEQEHDGSEDDLVSSGSDDGDLSDDDFDDGDDDDLVDEGGHDLKEKEGSVKGEKRKLDEYIGKINAADASLRALKKLAMAKSEMSEEADPILSNEDFKRIKEMKVFV